MIRLLLICFGLLISSFTFAECKEPIKFAGLTWESGQFTTAVLKKIIEKGYGCNVVEVSGSSSAQENALIQDDLQVIGEIWVGRSPVIQQGLSSKKIEVIGNTLKGGATQGWYIPHYLKVQFPELNTQQDLIKYASVFNNEISNKPQFLNCPTGWACEIFNKRLIQNTHLNQTFETVQPGTGAALDAEISAAYQRKKPILFYYWQPTGFMAKYNFVPIEFPAYNEKCWSDLLKKDNQNSCVSGFPTSTLSIAVSTKLKQQHPELIDLFEKIQFTPEQLNHAILEMNENKQTAEQQADIFLKNHPELLKQWLNPDMLKRFDTEQNTTIEQKHFFPNWDIQDILNQGLKSLVTQFAEPLRQFSGFLAQYFIQPVQSILVFFPAWFWIVSTGITAWLGSQRIVLTVFSMLGLYLIGAFGLWDALIQTTALLICSVLMTLLIGIPVGIAIAQKPKLYRIVQPILDVMQTMPSFVYLIPILMLFGLGNVPALFSTFIYAVAPLIRLTALGIQQVNPELQETGQAFGTSKRQQLFWVVLPLARPSIMAGINQAIMMSLSMVVLASMIGAPGLGENVLQAIQTLNVGQGIESGLAIVILAIIIDRITQAYGSKNSDRLKADKR